MTTFNKIKKLLVIHRQELLTLLFVVLLLFLTFGISVAIHQFEHKVIIAQRISVANQGFQSDMQYALDETRVASHSNAIRDSIVSNNVGIASTEITNFSKKYNLSTMVLVNNDGIALARTPSQRKGDFVFQTTLWGQEAAQGKEVVMVGEGRNYPLVINSAVPIITNHVVQGALFGGYILDNAYATEFKKKYLNPNEQVAFYSIKTGVYGTSFNDSTTERLFKLLFNDGSDAILGENVGLIAGHFKIGNTIFHVANVKLTDSNGRKVGGIFILTPAHINVPPIMAGLVGLVLLIPLFFHIRKRHKNKYVKVSIIVIALLLTAGGVAISIRSIERFLYHIPSPYTIYNSTMTFSPDADVFSGMAPQKIGIQITTGGEEINAAQAFITYDPSQVRMEDIIMDNSFCGEQFILEKTIDNKNGRVSVACGKPGGFFADRAMLAELLIQPLRPGQVNLQFSNDTSVLANDGLGTNVLRAVTNGSYQFINSPSTDATINTIALFSYSHPNPTRWYNSKTVHIEWFNLGDYKNFAYALDQKPNTIPDGKQTTNKKNLDFTAQNDGIYYFHLTPLVSGYTGATFSIKIMIDTTPPKIPEIKADTTTIKAGETVRLEFFSHGDNVSGLQKNFYISFDGGVWIPTLPQLDIFFEAGKHTVSLRVFDNAGNFSDTSTAITVQ